jgi:hypothetical protein
MANNNLTVLEKMDYLFICLKVAKTTQDRRNDYLLMLDLYKSNEEVQDWWGHCPSNRRFVDKFTKREEALSAKKKKKSFKGFADGIDYRAPCCEGLYFIGETHFNPKTNEKFYWVKIGKATNLYERMRNYNTHNPMLWRIAFNTKDYDKEKFYHKELKKVCLNTCNHNDEWFLVDEDTYFAMCEKGFKYFKK